MSQPASLTRAEAPAKRSLGTSAAPALRYDLTELVDVSGYPDNRETTSLESEYPAGALGRERTSNSGLFVSQVPAVPAVGPPAGNCHPSTSTTPLAEESVRNAAGKDDMTDDLSDNSKDDSEPLHSAVLRSKVVPTQEI
ncbi:hypothetical protein PtB15_10B235 [Puccinia triticina]|nr:hypothetical protein PtB15_10B235 [Puccinia triticina]